MAPHRSVVLLLLISALVLTVLRYVDGTHFRGGLIYCGPSPLSSNGEGFNSQGFPMVSELLLSFFNLSVAVSNQSSYLELQWCTA